jgi:hypothetical protein
MNLPASLKIATRKRAAHKLGLLVTMLIAAVTPVQSHEDSQGAAYRAKQDKLYTIRRRIEKVVPSRRESPMRSENIRDDEVREIQQVLAQVRPGAIVNIGTVVSGCPCEDGSSCSDQVWVVAHNPGTSVGLLLSRIDHHWTVGPVQQWWLDQEDLSAHRDDYKSAEAFWAAQEALTERFPMCPATK